MVKVGEQEERLDDVFHPAARCFKGTSRVFERLSDLILHPPLRASPTRVAGTAGNKDDVADDNALRDRRLGRRRIRGGPDIPLPRHTTHRPLLARVPASEDGSLADANLEQPTLSSGLSRMLVRPVFIAERTRITHR